MADEILCREKEFLKLNDELDKKTKSIIDKSAEKLNSHKKLHLSPRKSSILSKNLEKSTNEIVAITSAIQTDTQSMKSNTIPRPFRDNLTTRKFTRDKKLSSNNTERQTQTQSQAQTQTDKEQGNLEATINNKMTPPSIMEASTYDATPTRNELLNRSLKSLNKRTNAIITETFRNEKFHDSFSVENIVFDTCQDQIELIDSEIEENFSKKSMIKTTNKIINTNDNADNQSRDPIDENIPPPPAASSSFRNTYPKISRTSYDSPSMKSTNKTSLTLEPLTAKKNISSDGLIKFLKSKIVILQDELNNSTHLLAKRSKELETSAEIQKKLEHQRDQAIIKNNTLTEQLAKNDKEFHTSKTEFREREILLTAANREIEDLKRDLKLNKQSNINLEKRLYRANEEIENLKNNLNILKNNERESREITRLDQETQEKKLKSLKKQRSDLLTAYKKQIFLLDNLKRQNACMEQARMISFGEKEFNKVLEWNMKN